MLGFPGGGSVGRGDGMIAGMVTENVVDAVIGENIEKHIVEHTKNGGGNMVDLQ